MAIFLTNIFLGSFKKRKRGNATVKCDSIFQHICGVARHHFCRVVTQQEKLLFKKNKKKNGYLTLSLKGHKRP